MDIHDHFEEGQELAPPDALVPRMTRGLKRADEKLVALVKERPLETLTCALVLGYVLARWVGRRG
jgi:hypothetical protein